MAVNLTHHPLCHLWPPEDSRGGCGPGPKWPWAPAQGTHTPPAGPDARAEGPASRLVTGKKPIQARSTGLGPPCTWAGQVVEGLRSAPWAHLRSPAPFQKASDLSGGQVHVWPGRRGAWRAESGLGRGPHLHMARGLPQGPPHKGGWRTAGMRTQSEDLSPLPLSRLCPAGTPQAVLQL